jgi:fructose-bisphosphate aldolase class II
MPASQAFKEDSHMYVSMKEMLQHASVNRYAVPAPNCPDFNMVKAALAAAQANKSAVIIDVSPRQAHLNATPEAFAPMVRALAEPLNVPVALNLDHGAEFEDICRCIKAGFSSVMCDASSLPFEENIRRVQQVVAFAHAHGVSVEAELGHVGQAADGDGRSDDMYTKVDMAVEFVERTGCDALAVAIGTAHGNYPADYVPHLDFTRLAEIKAALGERYPLVLHGGSGAGDENFKKAVAGGINKINLWTDYSAAYVSAVRAFLADKERPDYLFVSTDAEEKASCVARALHAPLRLCGPLPVQ